MYRAVVSRAVTVLSTLIMGVSVCSADTTIFSDTWSYDDDQWGMTTSYFFGDGVTESDYDQNVGVELSIYAPDGAFLSYQSAFPGSSYARAEITQYVDAETSPEGDYRAEADHWGSSGFLGITVAPISSARYETRYIFDHFYFDNLGRDHWVYTRMLCGNRCQRDVVDGLAAAGDPPPYAQGVGIRWSVFGFGWCNITLQPAYNQNLTRCSPPN